MHCGVPHPQYTEGGALRRNDRKCGWLLEMDDETGGDACAIGVPAGGIEADVVYLGAEGQVRKEAEVHAAANAVCKLVGRAAASSGGDARAAQESLNEWVDLGGIAQSQARAEKIGVGVQRNASRRRVVAAKIADSADPVVEIICDRAADAVLVDAAGASQAEVGVADGGVNGLGPRGDGENG